MILSFYYLQIVKIENLAHLTELRVLNLAGNEIVNICNVSAMKALAELNLKRNKISTVVRMYVFFKVFKLLKQSGGGGDGLGDQKTQSFSFVFFSCLSVFFESNM